MSKVTITPLTEGDVATAANYNATVNSWNGSTAAGQLNDQNVREGGVDRRSLANRSIDLTRIGTTFSFTSSTASTAIVAGAGATVVNMGGADVQITGATVNTGDDLIVECSISGHCTTTGPNAGANSQTVFYLQVKVDAGAWTKVTESEQFFSINTVLQPDLSSSRVASFPWIGSYTTTILHSAGTGSVSYRLVCETSNENVVVETAVLYFREEAT